MKIKLFNLLCAGSFSAALVGEAVAQQYLPTIYVGGARNITRSSRLSQPKPELNQRRSSSLDNTVTQNTSNGGLPGSTQPPILSTTAGPVRGYEALTVRATRLETPIHQLPMNVAVIPRKLIDDQNSITQAEIFRNVSGLQPAEPRFPGGLGPKLRGMQAERYQDGLPNYYDYGVRDLTMYVERVEVIKGPSNILFQGGASPVGGVVNVVSKMPTQDRFVESGVRTGGYRYVSPWMDVNQPLNENKNILLRVVGQYETTGSVVDELTRRSYAINPTIKFTNNETTSVTLQGALNGRTQQDYPGLPAVGTIANDSANFIPYTSFLANKGLPNTKTEYSAVTLRLDHKFDETFSHYTAARWSSSNLYEPSQSTFGNRPFEIDFSSFGLPNYGGPTSFYVFNGLLNQQIKEVSVTSNFMAKFDIGPTKNNFLIGGDFNRVWDAGFLNGSNATGPDPALLPYAPFLELFGISVPPQLINYANPVFPPYITPYPGAYGFTRFSQIDNQYQNSGVTAQLQSNIYDKIHFLGAVRLALTDINSNEYAVTPPNQFVTNEVRPLPRLGLMYDVTDWMGVYGSYSEGLRAVAFFNGKPGDKPKPEGSQQYEVGIKLNGILGFSGTIDYFDLTRTNVPITPPGSVTQRQSGQQHSDGIEADIVWQPTQNVSFLAAFAHINARVSKDENTKLIDSRLPGVPMNSGRLWGNLSLDGDLQGWSIGAGLYSATGQTITIGEPWLTRGYITFDANIAYKNDNFSFALTGKNLGNQQYLVQYPFFDGRAIQEDGRAIFGTFSIKM
jgi:iron complex outermembrane receptor protein